MSAALHDDLVGYVQSAQGGLVSAVGVSEERMFLRSKAVPPGETWRVGVIS